jgi:fumarylacetoacetase
MALRSWVASANDPGSDFPLENLPYGVFRHAHRARIGVAIGDQILDVGACASEGLLKELASEIVDACTGQILNPLMSLGPRAWAALRERITAFLRADGSEERLRSRLASMLVPMREAEMLLPAQIGDYTDFYASVHHATRVGKLFRPDNPLLPNYKYVPIGYHGRASSIVVSGAEIRRPSGQTKAGSAAEPVFGPARSMDYELEMGFFVGPGNALAEPIPIAEAGQHIFGFCLVNDWSARDMQSWEYQPLGPFLAKSFATTISPWVVTMEALAPYRVEAAERVAGDPAPLGYLAWPSASGDAIDVTLEVYLQSAQMRQAGMEPMRMSRGNLRDLYWTPVQLLTHHASNGCNLRSGDLLATGTISGPNEGSEGCLLEMKHRAEPVRLPSGEVRTFLADGDQVTFRAYAAKEGLPRIGFGECSGMVMAAV